MLKKSKRFLTAVVSVITALAMCLTAFAAVPYGDVDNSGEIDVSDARLVLRFAVKLETPANDDIKKAADVNGDGDINVSDARLVLRFAVKLDTSFPAHDHIYGDFVTVKEPTCAEKGLKEKSCTICGGETIQEEIEALGHDFSAEWTVDTKATCTKDGSKSHHCSRCTEKSEVTVIPATGHDFSIDNSVFPKTEEEAGTNNLYIAASPVCKTCGNVPSKDISVFNNMTNIIKNNFKYRTSHSITRIVREDETTKCNELDFGLLWTRIVKKAMAEDFGTTTTYRYSDITRIASASSLPYLQYTVSNLTNEDVSKVSYTIQNGLKASDVMKDFGNTITVGTNNTKDLSLKKNQTWTGKVIKMQVTVKTENFTVGSKNANDLYTKYTKNNAYECALSRITAEINPVRDAQAYNMDANGNVVRSNYTIEETEDSMTMKMKLNSVSASGTITYYFDADTFEPLMAQYKLTETLNQRVDMSIIKIVNGYMIPIVTNSINQVYFFNAN